MSPYTIPDLVNMIIFAGAEPVFVDFDRNSTDISIDHLESLVDDKTAAVLVTHYHINQSRLSEMISLCEERGVALFEDCAISLGGTVDGVAVGSQSTGGIFSLSSYKFLNFFWGGAIYCKDVELQEQVAAQVRRWRRLGLRDYRGQMIRTMKYDFATRPLIYSMITSKILRYKQRRTQSLQLLRQPRIESESFDETLRSRPGTAALIEWNSKIENVEPSMDHRRKIATIYAGFFSGIAVGMDVTRQLNEGCFVNFPVCLGEGRRDTVYRKMILKGFDVGLSLYPNVHAYPKFQQYSGRSAMVDSLCKSIISLPCHPRVTQEYAERLSHALQSVY